MSDHETKEVQELITILNDSADFYREAHDKVTNASLKETFDEIAGIKEQLVDRLQPLVVLQKGEAEHGHSVSVKVRQIYTNVLASLQKDKAETFIDNLEEVEDKTRQQARKAMDAADTTIVAIALRDAFPDIERCHDEMSRLKAARAR